MTNEEAIFELGYAKDFQTPKRKEAIDMAIEALENYDKLAEDLQNCLEMYKTKKAEVEALKQNQWIPCSERLPKEDGLYLTTIENIMGKASVISGFRNGIWQTQFDVIAWMPKPEPWKGEQNDKG